MAVRIGLERVYGLAWNPHLKSRFHTIIDFPDYSNDELLSIFERLADEKRLILTRGIQNRVSLAIDQIPRGKGFGNAREIRKLFDRAIARQAVRLRSTAFPTADELSLLLPLDIPVPGAPICEPHPTTGSVAEGPASSRPVFGQPVARTASGRRRSSDEPTLLGTAPTFLGWRSEMAVGPGEVLIGRAVYHPDQGVGTVLTEVGGTPPTLRVRFDSGVMDVLLGLGRLEVSDF